MAQGEGRVSRNIPRWKFPIGSIQAGHWKWNPGSARPQLAEDWCGRIHIQDGQMGVWPAGCRKMLHGSNSHKVQVLIVGELISSA